MIQERLSREGFRINIRATWEKRHVDSRTSKVQAVRTCGPLRERHGENSPCTQALQRKLIRACPLILVMNNTHEKPTLGIVALCRRSRCLPSWRTHAALAEAIREGASEEDDVTVFDPTSRDKEDMAKVLAADLKAVSLWNLGKARLDR